MNELQHHARHERRIMWLRALYWVDLPIDELDDARLEAVYRYCERQLARRGSVHAPGVHRVAKERRRGRTNRLGWRWVAYVGESIDALEEVSAHTTRSEARKAARRARAIFFGAYAQSRLADPGTPGALRIEVDLERLPPVQVWRDGTIVGTAGMGGPLGAVNVRPTQWTLSADDWRRVDELVRQWWTEHKTRKEGGA